MDRSMSVVSTTSTFCTEADEPAERNVHDAECVRVRAGGHVPRQWDPMLASGHALVDKDRLLHYNKQEGYQQLRRAYMTDPQSWEDEVVLDTLVLSIAAVECGEDRECHHGRSCPEFAWGVSFGPGSRLNWRGILDKDYPVSVICALLEGLDRALSEIVNIVEAEPKIVRVRTTCKDLVEIMAWEREYSPEVQGFCDQISRVWREMESRYRITIQLWLVDSGEVNDAENLAHLALCS